MSRYAAKDGNNPHLGKARQRADLIADLCRQLARWRQHKRARSAASIAAEAVQQGQREGRRLAGTSLGEAQHIVPREGRGDGVGLDGSGLDKALGEHPSEDGRIEAEPVEAGRRIGQV